MTYTTSITPGRYSAEAVTSNLSVYTATVALTRPSNTTAYTAGDVIGTANTTTAANAGNAILTFPNVGGGGGAIRIDSVDLFINNTTVPSGMDAFRLHLYSIPPTAILDNAAFDLTSTDVPRYLGFVTLALPVDIGSTLYSSTVSVNKVVRMLPYSETLFGVLETRGGYTPSSGTLYTVKLNTTDVDEATTGSENLLWAYAGGAVPTLDLEFARTKTLNNQVTSTPPVTFTRASTATFVGSDRLIQTAAVDGPRFDHDPVTGESLGLLVEEARTNLLQRSEEFNDAYWVKSEATISSNVTTAPNGSTTADKLVETAVSGQHIVWRFFGSLGLASNIYTASVYAKAAERTELSILIDTTVTRRTQYFNLSTGALGASSGGITSTIQAVGNGWYRCSVTLNAAESLVNAIYAASVSGSNSYTGDGTSGLFIWGAQLETGSFPTSYIPTVASTVTRAADVASITGANFSSWYRQDEGTVFGEGVSNGANGAGFFTLEDGSASEYSRMGVGFSLLNFIVSKASGSQADVYSTGTSFVFGAPFRGVAAYALNNVGLSLNGANAQVDTTADMPSAANVLKIGFGKYATYTNGTIKRLTYWPTRLANSTLQQITTP